MESKRRKRQDDTDVTYFFDVNTQFILLLGFGPVGANGNFVIFKFILTVIIATIESIFESIFANMS